MITPCHWVAVQTLSRFVIPVVWFLPIYEDDDEIPIGIRIRIRRREGRRGRNRKERGDSQPFKFKDCAEWSGIQKEFGCESKQTGET